MAQRIAPTGLHVLASEHVSVVVDTSTPSPTIVHWGMPFDHDLGALVAARDVPIPHGGLDVLAPLSIVPEHGAGFSGRPGIEGRRPDGSAWAPRFTPVSVAATDRRIETVGVDEHAGLALRVEIELSPRSGVLRTRASITNRSPDRYDLDALMLSLPLPGGARETLTFGGRWCNEFVPVRTPWEDGTLTVENRTGRTSHGRMPIAFAGQRGFDDNHGEVWGVHVGWSGNSTVALDALVDGRRRVAAGELLLPGEIVLVAGDTYESPWVYGAYSCAGTNGCSQAFHRYLRDRPTHPTRPRPASLNTWEAVYFDHDLATLTALADRAAEIGMERFVLDDGWFHGRRDDRAGLGDWWVDPAVWPDGLAPLIRHVRARGMEFGIWVEPEMVNPDSDLYRAHPDWALNDPEYPAVLGRNQLVLDLHRDEVRDHLFAQLDALLRDHEIAYVKWDMNREIVHSSHHGRASVHHQTLGLYELIDRLRLAHPGVEIESCASGGGRIDFAILERTDRVWTSDCNDPLERQRIQRGFTHVFPPELMGAHIGAPTSHTTHRRSSLAMRAGTAVFGHFGIEWNLIGTTDEERAALAAIVTFYKQHRALLHGGDVVRLSHPNPAVLAHGVIAADRREAIVSFAQVATAASLIVDPLRIPGLDPDLRYEVRTVDVLGQIRGMARRQPGWVSDGLEISGVGLAAVGIQPPVLDPESLMLLHLRGRAYGLEPPEH